MTNVLKIEKIKASKGVCNLITQNSFNLVANNVHCSVHCIGDGGNTLFSIVKFLHDNVSEKVVDVAFYFNKSYKKVSRSIKAAFYR